MAEEDNGKVFQLIRCLKKFDGHDSQYTEWVEHTRTVIGMYKPKIERLIQGDWDPRPQYEEVYDVDVTGDGDADDNIYKDPEDEEQRDDFEEGEEYLQAQKDLSEAKEAATDADQELATAKETVDKVDETGKTTRAMNAAVESATTTAKNAHKIVELLEKQVKLMERKPPATRPSERKGVSPRPSRAGSARRVIVNQDELDDYNEADSQLYKILFLTLTDAASYVIKRYAPVDGSSGSGLEVWRGLTEKYKPANENRRRDLERELDGLRMKSKTDPEIFITKVWHLAEQINFIGGHITVEKQADIVLRGLPSEYELIRYNASAMDGYDLRKISDTARKLWQNRDKNDNDNSSSARDSGMAAIYENKSLRGQDARGKYRKNGIQCHNCRKYGHIMRNCPEFDDNNTNNNGTRRYNNNQHSRSSREGRQEASRSRSRQQKWCSLHRTHLHDDSECFAQRNGRNNRAAQEEAQEAQDASATQAPTARESRQSSWTRNSNRNNNNGAHVAQADRSGPTEETVVEGYCGNLGF